MADKHHIDTPEDLTVKHDGGKITLCWATGFSKIHSNMFNRKQAIVDSEVLRYCSPLIPFRTGTLVRSGTVGTVIGSGLVQYSTPYARFQYYSTAQTRSYDANRGGMWFERMKTAHKQDILRAAERG